MKIKKSQSSPSWRFFCVLALVVTLTSCNSNERMLRKFCSRFNAGEYDAASAYIYSDDLTSLAFFCQEVKSKNKNAFVEVEDSDYDSDTGKMVVEFRWKNGNELLYNYFAGICHPLSDDGTLVDTIRVYETTEGDRLAFNWGLPSTVASTPMMARVKSGDGDDVVKSVDIRLTPNGKVINALDENHSILADKSVEQGDSYPVWWVNDDGHVEQGFINAKQVSLTDRPFSSMGILGSMGLLTALIIAVVLLLPIYFVRGFFTGPGPAIVGLCILLACLYVFYMCIEKILFELFIINLPQL